MRLEGEWKKGGRGGGEREVRDKRRKKGGRGEEREKSGIKGGRGGGERGQANRHGTSEGLKRRERK